jgi:hypothetical protein
MNHFDKKKLHNFSRFAVKHHTGLVHETFKNVFVNQTMVGEGDNRKSLKMIQDHEDIEKPPEFEYDNKAYVLVQQEIETIFGKNKDKKTD